MSLVESPEEENYEYERRWLVRDLSVLDGHRGTLISQAYLLIKDGWTVRVRRSYAFGPARPGADYEGHNTLAIKGPRAGGRRLEVEQQLDAERAKVLFGQSQFRLFKSRFHIIDTGHLYDVDVFHVDNAGLAIAERETSGPDASPGPTWCGREVTDDDRYNNERLAEHPYEYWSDDERSEDQ